MTIPQLYLKLCQCRRCPERRQVKCGGPNALAGLFGRGIRLIMGRCRRRGRSDPDIRRCRLDEDVEIEEVVRHIYYSAGCDDARRTINVVGSSGIR